MLAKGRILKKTTRRKGRVSIRNGKKQLSFFIPNIITLTGMCSGITSIHLALCEKWIFVIVAIIFAVFMDFFDGRVARKLKVASEFGAELDSLSDFSTFGIAPAVIMYVFSLNGLGKVGWGVGLLFTMCMALRLARFNIMRLEPKPIWLKDFSVGVPAPAGACLVLLPLVIEIWLSIRVPVVVIAVWTIIVAGLLVSKVPTFLIKADLNVYIKHLVPFLVIFLVFLMIAYSYFWFTVVMLSIAYIISIPISLKKSKKIKNNFLKEDAVSSS